MISKKIIVGSVLLSAVAVLSACSDVRRDPGRVYMPDMAYSRAYETYAITAEQRDRLAKEGIHYSNTPVPGTIKRGELFPFTLSKDQDGDSTNYVAAKQVKSPVTTETINMTEAERLYLVNCGICHGPKLDGNGPLYKGGEGPYPAKPATLVGDAKYEAMPEGQMYYSVTYGKNKMGSYASQLDTKQRWMVIHYIKSMQAARQRATAEPAAQSMGAPAGSQTSSAHPSQDSLAAQKNKK